MPSTRPIGRVPALLGLLATLTVAGCGTDPTVQADPFARVAVSGTVTIDGAPLPAGTIQLEPAAETKGPIASADISQGKFALARSQGPVAGKYKVRVSGLPPVKIGEADQPGGSPVKAVDPVPAKFNAKTTLETEIPAGGSSSLDFAIKK